VVEERRDRVGPVNCVGKGVELETVSMARYHIRRALHKLLRVFVLEGLDRQGSACALVLNATQCEHIFIRSFRAPCLTGNPTAHARQQEGSTPAMS